MLGEGVAYMGPHLAIIKKIGDKELESESFIKASWHLTRFFSAS
jgi:predicted membrane-bound dolichyl-phosphate-mannose-protein mannosyltransferase